MKEEAMSYLENHIPELAELAVKQAYWQTLAAGLPVLECVDGTLVETHPDGSRKIIKYITPPRPVTPGHKSRLDK